MSGPFPRREGAGSRERRASSSPAGENIMLGYYQGRRGDKKGPRRARLSHRRPGLSRRRRLLLRHRPQGRPDQGRRAPCQSPGDRGHDRRIRPGRRMPRLRDPGSPCRVSGWPDLVVPIRTPRTRSKSILKYCAAKLPKFKVPGGLCVGRCRPQNEQRQARPGDKRPAARG